jgi:integrase
MARYGRIANITKRTVDAAKAEESRFIVWDRELKGFGLRVEPTGLKTYVVRYRPGAGGRTAPLRQLVIGRHGPLTPDEARRVARETLVDVMRGADPVGGRASKRKEPTIADLVERWVAEHLSVHNKPTTAKEFERIARVEIIPELGSSRIGDITRSDIRKWHSGKPERPYQANRALAVLRKILSLAVKEWELRGDNPALGIKQFRERRRERYVSDDELRIIGPWLARAEKEGTQPPGAILIARLLAFTAMRLGEALYLDRSQVDLKGCVVRLTNAKAGPRGVPIPTAAGQLLADAMAGQRSRAGAVARDFDGSPLSLARFRTFWNALRAGTGITDIRPHDFRHMGATFGAQTGANAFLLRDYLGHATLEMSGGYVERVVDPIRDLAEKVAARVAVGLEGQPSADVVPLQKQGRAP